MSDASKRILRTIGSLILAVLNATLILLALCLWLAWNVVGTARSIAADVGAQIDDLRPFQASIAQLKDEVAELRLAVQSFETQDGGLAAATLRSLQGQVVTMDEKLGQVSTRLGRIVDDPTVLIDHAIGTAAARTQEGIAALMECTPSVTAGG